MPAESDSTRRRYRLPGSRHRHAPRLRQDPAEQQQAEQEGIELRDRIRAAYPFHPALIDLMRERWAAIPDFQRTRGALRFLAAACAPPTPPAPAAPSSACDVPLQDPKSGSPSSRRSASKPDFQACLEHDFVGANARARRIDERRAKEFPAEAIKRPATRIATAILMYSFGGLRREGANETEILPPGISEADLWPSASARTSTAPPSWPA